MKELSININIAGRTYPLTINPDDEVNVRAAGKLIQDKLQAYSKQFSIKDNQDVLAMFALEITTDYLKQKEANALSESLTNKQLIDIIEELNSI